MGVFPTWGHLAKNGFLGPERYLEFKGDWAYLKSLKGTITSSLDYVCLSSSITDLCNVHLESLACHTLQHDTNPDPPLCLILSPHSKGPLSRSQVQSLSFSSWMAIPVVPSGSFRDQRWGVIRDGEILSVASWMLLTDWESSWGQQAPCQALTGVNEQGQRRDGANHGWAFPHLYSCIPHNDPMK